MLDEILCKEDGEFRFSKLCARITYTGLGIGSAILTRVIMAKAKTK